jgi:thioredoxin 1
LWRVFWLAFLVLSLAYAWYSFYVPDNDVEWAPTYAVAQEKATASGKPMLLFFTAEWCVPCRIMKREVFADREVMALLNADWISVMIYPDDPGAEALYQRYTIGGTPITILSDPLGNVIDYAVGGINKAEFLELIGKP